MFPESSCGETHVMLGISVASPLLPVPYSTRQGVAHHKMTDRVWKMCLCGEGEIRLGVQTLHFLHDLALCSLYISGQECEGESNEDLNKTYSHVNIVQLLNTSWKKNLAASPKGQESLQPKVTSYILFSSMALCARGAHG